MTTDELLQRWSDGSITTEELRELTAKLAEPEHRGALLDGWLLESSLPDRLPGASVAVLHESTMNHSDPLMAPMRGNRWTNWLSWRPITAAAAGIAFGLFSASMVFAYAVPRAVAMATRLSELVDGSFENAAEPLPSGLPEEFGVWSGKEPNQVRVDVVDGQRVLRFLECKRGPSAVLQLIDLRSLRADPNEGEAKLVLSARIRDDRAEVGDPFRFSMHLSLFSGSPDSLRETWPTAKKEAISSGSAVLESRGGTPKSWRELSAKTLVPPGADFALVQIGVLDPGAFPKHSATFGEQFVDDVQLTLQIQPELPVRVAQH